MGKAAIYYFTGTGNSLAVAKSIAAKTNGELIAIPSVIRQESIHTEASVIGIVFPVYYASNDSGIPRIIGRFVDKLDRIGSKYLFAVCTHGGGPGATIENLNKMIQSRGGELAAGFTAQMANKPLPGKELSKMRRQWEKKLTFIGGFVNAEKKGRLETRSGFGKILLAPLLLLIKPVFYRRYQKLAGVSDDPAASHLPFQQLIPMADQSFRTNKKCNGCAICAMVCPVRNIEMIENKPVWRHDCETCYACYQWCPHEAIYGEIVAYNPRYSHPDAKLADMLGNEITKP